MDDLMKSVGTLVNSACSSEALKPVVTNEISNIVRRMGGSGGATDMFLREGMVRKSFGGDPLSDHIAGWLFKKFLGRF